MGEMVKIRYAKGEKGWAEELGDGKYRIDNIPLTDRLNIDDLVRCRLNDDGELVVSRRLKRRYPEKTLIRSLLRPLRARQQPAPHTMCVCVCLNWVFQFTWSVPIGI